MDIQFITNPHACIKYICDYLTKSNKELTKLLREEVEKIKNGDDSIKSRLHSVANTLVNGTVITAQEAVYIILEKSLSTCSRSVEFINTISKKNRNRMLKTKADLAKLHDEDTDIPTKFNVG